MEVQKKIPCTVQTPHQPTFVTTEAPSLMSIDHSEPECEVHPNEETCENHSNLKKSNLSQKMQQQSYVDIEGIKTEKKNSPKDCWFLEECESSGEEHESNTPLKNEEGEKSPQEVVGWNASFAEESKTEKSVSSGDANEERLSSYNGFHEVPKDRSSFVLDDFSSTNEFEHEKDLFSVPFFEDDLSLCLDIEGTDSDIQVAVNEIRKEAEKIDTILVLDQFKTLQAEFDSLTKKCSVKTMENEDLKTQLQESENRVAHMELERDLHEADAAKLREDLKTVVSKMFDISMYESAESIQDEKVVIEDATDSCPTKKSPKRVYEKNQNRQGDETSIASLKSEKIRIVGLIDQPRHVIQRMPLLSDPGSGYTKSHSQYRRFTDSDTFRLPPSSSGNQPLRNQDVFRKRSNHITRRPRTESVRVELQNITAVPSDCGGNDFGRTVMRLHKKLSAIDTHSTSSVTETYDEEKEREKKRCGLFFRRRSKQQSFSKEDVSLLKEQIKQLHETMRGSLAASGKLRKRLAVISRYYEGVISKLQTKLTEAKSEQSRIQAALANTLSEVDLERRLVKSKFEYEIQRKDEEIARLKSGRDQGEV